MKVDGTSLMFLRVILMCPRSLFQSLCKFSVEEVEDPGNQREKVLPPDTGHGFLWRLYSHWRFEERDDGVYVECRAISLTRDVPFGLRWAIEPIIQKLPQESLTKTLEAARIALQARKQFVLFWLGATAERRGLPLFELLFVQLSGVDGFSTTFPCSYELSSKRIGSTVPFSNSVVCSSRTWRCISAARPGTIRDEPC